MVANDGRLSPLQVTLLQALSDMEPSWTLVGGAALVGVYLGHRETRDLDLFWRGKRSVQREAAKVERLLGSAPWDFTVDVIQRESSFVRLRVSGADEVVILDLVADPTPEITPDEQATVGGATIRVASMHEILVNKLCALLGRSEVRDLVDVKALLEAGGDLARALRDAPREDAGFSPLTLAWVIKDFRIERLARAAGQAPESVSALVVFKDDLVERLVDLAKP